MCTDFSCAPGTNWCRPDTRTICFTSVSLGAPYEANIEFYFKIGTLEK